MRSFSLGSTLVLASLLFSAGTYAQTAGKPEAAMSQVEAWAPRAVGNLVDAGPSRCRLV